MQGSYDVFFSYHTVDHAMVTQVAEHLHDRGIRVFLDRWYLVAGQPWPQALEQTLASCGAVAVFLGAEGLGPWQQRERDLALDRQGQEPGFPVIPVLLSAADPALGFLKLNTWVDLSAGVANEAALDILAAAIRRQAPGPLALQRIAAVLAEVCPYRGLRPFREEDEPFFFGREAFTETLATTLARQPFVAVVGASGSGKSSVVRAGLIPRLRRGEGGFVWDVVVLVPTDRPLASLAAALLPSLEPDLSEVDRLAEVNKLATHLAEGSVGLRDITARVMAKQRGTDRLLLFVDQWEELYTLCPDEKARRAFATHLLEAAAAGPVRVVLTMRGDFFGRALADRALSDQLQDAVITIGPMTRGELAKTIVKPAEAVGLAFEAGLAETILDDVGEEPGSLPLLEFLLEALWKERRGALLHYDAYHRLGRVPGAIAHRAEEVFERGLTEAERQAAQRLLIRLVRPGEGVEDTRQRAAMPAADPVAEATIRKLADARLVVTERDAATGRETVEVAHEALIRGWRRLRGWVDQDREFLRTRERIAAQAKLWESEGRLSDRLLRCGRPLAEGEDLLTRRNDLEPPIVAFIEASAATARAEEEATRATNRRRVHIARLIAAVMTVLAVAAGGFAYWWQTERQAALLFADRAAQNSDRAMRNEFARASGAGEHRSRRRLAGNGGPHRARRASRRTGGHRAALSTRGGRCALSRSQGVAGSASLPRPRGQRVLRRLQPRWPHRRYRLGGLHRAYMGGGVGPRAGRSARSRGFRVVCRLQPGWPHHRHGFLGQDRPAVAGRLRPRDRHPPRPPGCCVVRRVQPRWPHGRHRLTGYDRPPLGCGVGQRNRHAPRP